MGKPFVPQALPIKNVDWEKLIPHMGRANRAISEYNGVLYGVPNPDVLLSPLTTQEAVLSSRIEGTQATFGDLLLFDAGVEPAQESRKQDITEIVNYRSALQYAKKGLEVRPFNINLLLELHDILLDSVRGRDKGRGRFRTAQNWIGAPGSTIEEADFVPPEPGLVPKAMHEWESYYHAERPDPLVQLAVTHAQFEIIHPFLDGNGRLGRILIPLFLFEKHVLAQPMFYLSAYLDQHRDEYIRLLRDLGEREDAWNSWIVFFLCAIVHQAEENTRKARGIMDLYERLKRDVISITHSQYAVPILDAMFTQPIFRASDVRKRTSIAPPIPTTMSLLGKLESHGVLKIFSRGSGRRPTVYAFPELINLCEGRVVI